MLSFTLFLRYIFIHFWRNIVQSRDYDHADDVIPASTRTCSVGKVTKMNVRLITDMQSLAGLDGRRDRNCECLV